MITKERVASIILDKIAGSDMFIVEIRVRPGNAIDVTMDGDNGVNIEACMDIHRHILHEMDRDVEDYSLEVSSPDLSKPLIVQRQYVKNIGRNVAIKKTDKTKLTGTLLSVNDETVVLHTAVMEDVPGKKGKKSVEKEIEIPFTEIVETKIEISFK